MSRRFAPEPEPRLGGVSPYAFDINTDDIELAPDIARRQVDPRDDPVELGLRRLGAAMRHETDNERATADDTLLAILNENPADDGPPPPTPHAGVITRPAADVEPDPARRTLAWRTRYRRNVIVGDVVAGIVGTTAAFFSLPGGREGLAVVFALVAMLVVAACLSATGAWRSTVLGEETGEYTRVVWAMLALFATLSTAVLAAGVTELRAWVFVLAPVTAVCALAWHYLLRQVVQRARHSGECLTPVLVCGNANTARDLIARTRATPRVGWRVDAVCTAKHMSDDPADIDGVAVIGDIDGVADYVRRGDYAVVAITADPLWTPRRLQRLAWQLEGSGAELVVAPTLMEIASQRLRITGMLGMPLLRVSAPGFTGVRRVVKTGFDKIGAVFLLALLSPLMLASALAIVVDSRGPVFYTQRRVGKDGKEFRIIKFRTMIKRAELLQAKLAAANEGAGVLFKMRKDPRVTRVGALLRRYSVDDLPQLLNVLSGAMSLVGPRPPLPEESARYAPEVRRRLLVKPGITGLWQVSGRSDLSWEESVRLDLRYVEDWSLTLDAWILWNTVRAVLSGAGAY